MIAIKNMEMPKRCSDCTEECYYKRLGGNICERLDKNTNDERWKKRLDDCPLVEIINCNGCKYWDKDSSPRVPDNKEYHFCPMMDCNTAKDFFCAEAKRRE